MAMPLKCSHESTTTKFNYLQSNEVKSSNHMEHMGLVRALKCLADDSLHVATLVTDRHNQIAKYMAEVKLEIEHCYDIWHVTHVKFT